MPHLIPRNTARLRRYIQAMTRLVEEHGANESRMLSEGEKLLKDLIDHDDWLPDEFAQPSPDSYRQYLLHCDPLERFSVVSFVWGLVGVMRGAEVCEEFTGTATAQSFRASGSHRIEPGEIDRLSPTIGDIHVVSNAFADRASVSIHVYGANIGTVKRHVFDAASGAPREFVSGYHNSVTPNLWDCSQEAR